MVEHLLQDLCGVLIDRSISDVFGCVIYACSIVGDVEMP